MVKMKMNQSCIVAVAVLILVLCSQGHSQNGMALRRSLCRSCEVMETSCTGTGSCASKCDVSTICSGPEDVCVSIWRKKDDKVTMDTFCHNPAQRLHGLLLDDYNSSKCEMKERKSNEPGYQFYICSCSGDNCNDHVHFPDTTSAVSMNQCCLQYQNDAVFSNQIQSYRMTATDCPQKGVIFTTTNGTELCADSDAEHIQTVMEEVDYFTNYSSPVQFCVVNV